VAAAEDLVLLQEADSSAAKRVARNSERSIVKEREVASEPAKADVVGGTK